MTVGSEVQEAFRRGVRGEPLARPEPQGLDEAPTAFAAGANEAALLELQRLAGLSDAGAAYETGRALRFIVQLFDRAGAPERVGRQFIDNLGGAVVIERMRGRTQPWAAADTVDMFVEMYSRILDSRPAELERIRAAVMDYAVGPGTERSRQSQRLPWFRRPA